MKYRTLGKTGLKVSVLSYGADIAQLAIPFAISNPKIATTQVGTANAANLIKNVKSIESAPDPKLLAEVDPILQPIRNGTWPSGRPERN